MTRTFAYDEAILKTLMRSIFNTKYYDLKIIVLLPLETLEYVLVPTREI